MREESGREGEERDEGQKRRGIEKERGRGNVRKKNKVRKRDGGREMRRETERDSICFLVDLECSYGLSPFRYSDLHWEKHGMGEELCTAGFILLLLCC